MSRGGGSRGPHARSAGGVVRDEALREVAPLDVLEHVPHSRPYRRVDDALRRS